MRMVRDILAAVSILSALVVGWRAMIAAWRLLAGAAAAYEGNRFLTMVFMHHSSMSVSSIFPAVLLSGAVLLSAAAIGGALWAGLSPARIGGRPNDPRDSREPNFGEFPESSGTPGAPRE